MPAPTMPIDDFYAQCMLKKQIGTLSLDALDQLFREQGYHRVYICHPPHPRDLDEILGSFDRPGANGSDTRITCVGLHNGENDTVSVWFEYEEDAVTFALKCS